VSYATYLWTLLKPLGPYPTKGVYTAGELACEGKQLDDVSASLDELEREAFLDTAQTWGLDKIESLLTRRPVATSLQSRRAALAALLRISGDSFTLNAINDNLKGCGLNAVVQETNDPSVVEVRFPDVPGIPDSFDTLQKIIEDILPCHLQINYIFWFITWQQMESRFSIWKNIEAGNYDWENLEKLVR